MKNKIGLRKGANELIIELADKVINGGEITRQEALELAKLPDSETPLLLAMADKIRQHFVGDKVDLCSIVSGRSGHCPENCAFCAQSAYHKTDSPVHSLLPEEEILETARKAKEAGACRFSIVTSGRSATQEGDFDRIVETLHKIKQQYGLNVCASLGILSPEAAKKLKEAGVSRYHANVETSRSYFPNVCTTHTYEDKLSTIAAAKAAGMGICSGGIIGMGETLEQRVEMAFEIKDIGAESVPLNILNPIAGTRFADKKAVPPMELLKTFALFRFILPKAALRTAGGREKNLRDLQSMALTSGLNGMLIGGYLTTGGRSEANDLQMLEDLGRTVMRVEETAK